MKKTGLIQENILEAYRIRDPLIASSVVLPACELELKDSSTAAS
jgi:hypothetical protein